MIGDKAPLGGILETIGGAQHPMRLLIGGIERLEERHRSVYDVWDGFFNGGRKPTSVEVRDIICMGLVGAGMKEGEADAVIAKIGADEMLKAYEIAQGVLGVAFLPSVAETGKKKAASKKASTRAK